MLEDVDRVIMPGITHWQSPNFFAYFPCNASGPGILGELLSAGLNVQGMMWSTSPACTELEAHVLDWVADLLDLPAKFRSSGKGGGVIQDTASSASLVALVAARERATGGVSKRSGSSDTLVAYASEEAHSSIEKALGVIGIGADRLRKVPSDEHFAMDPDALADCIAEDRATGLTPFAVCATVGTTSSSGMDPLRRIGGICRHEELWLHVDAAMSGTAAICPEYRHLLDGLELAKQFADFPDRSHHIRRGDGLIETEPAALNFFQQFVIASEIGTGIKGFFFFLAFCKNEHLDLFADPVRQNHTSPNHLIRMPGVNAQSNSDIHRLIKLGIR